MYRKYMLWGVLTLLFSTTMFLLCLILNANTCVREKWNERLLSIHMKITSHPPFPPTPLLPSLHMLNVVLLVELEGGWGGIFPL